MNKSKILFAGLLLSFTIPCTIAEDKMEDNTPYIIGHWNYPANSANPVYVISDGDDVELFINGISTGHGRKEHDHLFTFDNVYFQPGILMAVSYDIEGKELGRSSLATSGVPAQIRLSVLETPEKAESDEALIQCEITDFYGKRCLSDNRTVFFEIEEPAESGKKASLPENISKKQLTLHNGETCLPIKKTSKSGEIKVTAKAQGLAPAYLNLNN